MPWRAGNDYRWRGRRSAASWLASALDQLDEPVSALVGHSFGSNAVLELLAADDRPPFAAAVLTSPFFCPPQLRVTWKVFEQARRNFTHQVREGLRARLGSRVAAMEGEVLEAMMAKAIDRIGPAGFLAAFDQFVSTADLRLANVTVPTLVLGGGSDPTLGWRDAAALARAMPSAIVVIEEGYDHFCHVRQVMEVARRIAAFLQEIPADVKSSAP
jgi:pimeloyl-ACP methyl ester carboxylesterase